MSAQLKRVEDTPIVGTTNDLVFNPVAMQQMQHLATLMASSKATIPAHLKGSVGDCFAIIMQAAQWRMNPFAVAQKTFLVNGVLGYEAQLVNSVVVNSGVIQGRFKYEFIGDWTKVQGKTKELESKSKIDDSGRPKKFRVPAWSFNDEVGLGVTVTATLAGETEPRELTLFMTQALTRNSAQWADDPQQQLSYLAVKKWSRRYAPDVILGVYSPDELETIEPQEKIINPLPDDAVPVLTAAELITKINGATMDELTPDALRNMDIKPYTDTERMEIKNAITQRRKTLKAEAVVATQDKQPEPEAPKAEAPKAEAPAQAETSAETGGSGDEEAQKWMQLIQDAQSADEVAAIYASIPDNLKAKFNDLVDEKIDSFR